MRALANRRFGHDFDAVRVHRDAEAARSARQLGAAAFTVGTDVMFGIGAYAPDSPSGRRLLFHELVHVVQQSAAAPYRAGTNVAEPTSAVEQEAERLSSHPESGPVRVECFVPTHQLLLQRTHPDPDCDDLLVKIMARVLELYLRADALIRNPLRLPQSGPMSIEGHQQQFRNKQVNLRAMLNQWDTNNCGDGYLPGRAWEWATRPVPSPNARPPVRVPIATSESEARRPVRGGGSEGGREWSRDIPPREVAPGSGEGLSAGEAAVAAGATVAGGYLVYRAIRMVPSLLPPLWWTIPGNVAVP